MSRQAGQGGPEVLNLADSSSHQTVGPNNACIAFAEVRVPNQAVLFAHHICPVDNQEPWLSLCPFGKVRVAAGMRYPG